jgi:aldehyde dehydrogenase (NAD+)
MGNLYNTGQDCTCSSRLYIQSSVYDKFVALLESKVQEYKVGPGHDESSSAGPLVSKTQFEKVWAYIEAGKAAGAEVLYGGEQQKCSKGYFVSPVGECISLTVVGRTD